MRLAHHEKALGHAVLGHLGAAPQRIAATGAGPILIDRTARRAHKGAGLAGALEHAQHGQGKARVRKGAHGGEGVQEFLAGNAHVAAQAQHVVGRERQGQLRAAAVEAGHLWIAVKTEGFVRLELGQAFQKFAAFIGLHEISFARSRQTHLHSHYSALCPPGFSGKTALLQPWAGRFMTTRLGGRSN